MPAQQTGVAFLAQPANSYLLRVATAEKKVLRVNIQKVVIF
jgi:hypothetical protein